MATQDLNDLVHHTDRSSQYASIRFTERLAEAGVQPSVGAVGSSYGNALTETINGLYKTELIKPGKPRRTVEDVELATPLGRLVQSTSALRVLRRRPTCCINPPNLRPESKYGDTTEPRAHQSLRTRRGGSLPNTSASATTPSTNSASSPCATAAACTTSASAENTPTPPY